MNSDAFIYSIERGDRLNALQITECSSAVRLDNSYRTVTPVVVDGTPYLFANAADLDYFDLYRFSARPPWLEIVSAKPKLAGVADAAEFFVIGNLPHLMTYSQKDGQSAFFAIAPDLSMSKPYKHSNDISAGYTTVKVFTYFGQIGVLAYNGDNGAVAIYGVSVISTSSGDVPPLEQRAIWTHTWAKGWTRFAIYQFGGENFFLKTNTERPNVNIDHILDDPKQGTIEVASHIDLEDALQLDLVQSFSLTNGEPYFLTYRKDSGLSTFNRFHSDCAGWTKVGSISAKPQASNAVFISADDKLFLVVT